MINQCLVLLRCGIATLALFVIRPSDAQEAGTVIGTDTMLAQWTSETKIVTTLSLRNAFAEEMVASLKQKGSEAGFSSDDVAYLIEGTKPAVSLKVAGGGAWGIITGGAAVTTELRLRNSQQLTVIRNTFSLASWGPSLSTYPTITLAVIPVPPMDYRVEINGTVYPATDKSVYGVAPGLVNVRVTRGDKAPCVWTGQVKDGDQQKVNCSL